VVLLLSRNPNFRRQPGFFLSSPATEASELNLYKDARNPETFVVKRLFFGAKRVWRGWMAQTAVMSGRLGTTDLLVHDLTRSYRDWRVFWREAAARSRMK
jgi:hypothetical protein